MDTLHLNETHVFAAGDQVTPKYTNGYHLTMGKVYTVREYDPPAPQPGGFTFPAYVSVEDDRGVVTWAHARRFKEV